MTKQDVPKICCFTGHRHIIATPELNYKLHEAISFAITEENVQTFMSGMALGFDMLAAETVLSFKEAYPQIDLHCILPCRDQDKYFSEVDKKRYLNILSCADKIVYTSQDYSPWCMHVRNDYLVDYADLALAYLVNNRGGTFYTVSRAIKKGIPIKNLALS